MSEARAWSIFNSAMPLSCGTQLGDHGVVRHARKWFAKNGRTTSVKDVLASCAKKADFVPPSAKAPPTTPPRPTAAMTTPHTGAGAGAGAGAIASPTQVATARAAGPVASPLRLKRKSHDIDDVPLVAAATMFDVPVLGQDYKAVWAAATSLEGHLEGTEYVVASIACFRLHCRAYHLMFGNPRTATRHRLQSRTATSYRLPRSEDGAQTTLWSSTRQCRPLPRERRPCCRPLARQRSQRCSSSRKPLCGLPRPTMLSS